MNVTVEYTAQFKRAAGVASETVEIDEQSSLQSVLRSVASQRGGDFESILLDNKSQLHSSILVFVCDQQTSWDSDPGLKDGDTITLLAPISGG